MERKDLNIKNTEKKNKQSKKGKQISVWKNKKKEKKYLSSK